MLVLALPALRICTVWAPLATTRVSGSQTWLRIPSWAFARPATSSRLISLLLRGAGPPNKASIACCCASPGVKPAVPATGGARLKSGGMISGALRATANSSGAARLPLIAAHPLVARPATMTRAEMALRMFDSLLGLRALRSFLRGQERAHQQDHDRDANRCVPDIEDQKRPDIAEVKVEEVRHIAVERAVEDVAERSPEHHPQRGLVEPVLLAPDPHRDADGDRARHRDQHPAPDRVGRIEQAERNALVLGVSEIEDRQQHQLVANLVDPERTGHHPFRQLVEREHDQRDREPELA